MKFFSKGLFLLLYCFSLFSFAAPRVAVTLFDSPTSTANKMDIYGDMSVLGSMDKKMRSFRINKGYEVRFYEGTHFAGGSYTRTSANDGKATGFENKIRSLRVTKYPSSGVPIPLIVYAGKNFTGSRLDVKGHLGDMESFDSKVLSYRIGTGYQVRFYTEKGFQGKYYTRTGNAEDISAWGKPARSIMIAKNGTASAVHPSGGSSGTQTADKDDAVDMSKLAVKIYSEDDWKGSLAYITEGVTDLESIGWDKKMQSFQVQKDFSVRFFEKTDYEGGYYTRAYGEKDEKRPSFGGKISSIKILDTPEDNRTDWTTSFGGSGRPPFDKLVMTLWDHAFKKGTYMRVYQHVHTWDPTRPPGFHINSYSIANGYWVRFWTQPGFKGGYFTKAAKAAEQNSCAAFGDCEKYKSFEIMDKTNFLVAELYQLDRYRGNEMDIRNGPWDDAETINRRGKDLPTVASIKVAPGYEVTIYSEKINNTPNPRMTFTQNNSQIRYEGQLLRVKSISWRKR